MDSVDCGNFSEDIGDLIFIDFGSQQENHL